MTSALGAARVPVHTNSTPVPPPATQARPSPSALCAATSDNAAVPAAIAALTPLTNATRTPESVAVVPSVRDTSQGTVPIEAPAGERRGARG
jgi:hypothetical protein